MKTLTIALTFLLLTVIISCTPSGGTGTTPPIVTPSIPASSYDITLNGHSYHRSSSSQILPILNVGIGSTLDDCQTTIVINDAPYITAWFWGMKTDTINKIGTYKVIGGVTTNQTIQDNGTNITYFLAPNSSSTSSGTITVSTYTSSEIKGTFNIYGTTDDVNFYNITGAFDYHH